MIQSGGTNYPTMVADLDDGSGPILVKYIHLRADADFGLNEIFCYEYGRLTNDDLEWTENNTW